MTKLTDKLREEADIVSKEGVTEHSSALLLVSANRIEELEGALTALMDWADIKHSYLDRSIAEASCEWDSLDDMVRTLEDESLDDVFDSRIKAIIRDATSAIRILGQSVYKMQCTLIDMENYMADVKGE